MARRDEADRQKGAYIKGHEEGWQEGRQEERFEVARNLLKENTPVDLIVRATGLTFEEVKKLAAEPS
jgi:predicted transposase/invertase (TIGR01784 family)